jgi:hypothetical protein
MKFIIFKWTYIFNDNINKEKIYIQYGVWILDIIKINIYKKLIR